MAEITRIDFKALRRPTPTGGELRLAEIVIFPGVRIERWTQQTPSAKAQQQKSAPKSATRKRRKRAVTEVAV